MVNRENLEGDGSESKEESECGVGIKGFEQRDRASEVLTSVNKDFGLPIPFRVVNVPIRVSSRSFDNNPFGVAVGPGEADAAPPRLLDKKDVCSGLVK
jgi:hypothetical protein